MPINKGKILQNAQKYVAQGKYELAIEEYKKIVQDNPKDWNTFIQIGNLYLKIGKNAEAINNLRKVADYYYQDGQHARATALYKQINKINPALEDVSLRLADLYIKQGLVMDAKSQLILLGEHFTKKGQINQAAEVFKRLIELEPDNLKARIELAKIYRSLGDINAAVNEYLAVSEEYEKQNLMAECLKILENALELQPSNTVVLKKVVETYNRTGAPNKAIELLERLIETKKPTSEIYMQLAASYYKSKKYEKTEEILKKCIEADNFYIPAYDSLVQLLINQDKIIEAFDLVDELSKKLIQKREGEKAIPFLKQMIDIVPNRCDIAERLAEIYIDLHQENNAISVLNKLMETLIIEKNYKEAERIVKKILIYEPDNLQYQEKLNLIISYTRPEELKVKKEREPLIDNKSKPSKHEVHVKEKAELVDEEVKVMGVKEEKQEKIKEIEQELKVGETIEEDIEIEIDLPEEHITTQSQEIIQNKENSRAELSLIEEVAEEKGGEKIEIEVEEEHYNQLEIDEMHEFIREHLIEAEVFNKYGLIDKAIEQLEMIINRYPLTVEAYLKLKDIYLYVNNKENAVKQYIRLIKVFRDKGEKDKVNEFIEAAKRIDPKNVELLSLIGEPVKKDAFTEVEKLEQLYTSRKAVKTAKKEIFKNLDDLALEIDITRDIEDIASIKEMMEGGKEQEIVAEAKEKKESDKVEIAEEEMPIEEKKEEKPLIEEEIKEEMIKEAASLVEEITPAIEREKFEEIKEEIIEKFKEIDLSLEEVKEKEEIQKQKGSEYSDLEFKLEKEEVSVNKAFDDSIATLDIKELDKDQEGNQVVEEIENISDNKFAETIINSIDERLNKGDIEGASEIVQEACALYGDLPFLLEKQKEIDIMKEKMFSTKVEEESFGELIEEEDISLKISEEIDKKEEAVEHIKEVKEERIQNIQEVVPEESFVIEEEVVDFTIGITEEELEKEVFKEGVDFNKKDEASSTSEMELEEIFSNKEQQKEEIIIQEEKEKEVLLKEEPVEGGVAIEFIELGQKRDEGEENIKEKEELMSEYKEEESFFDLASELENEMMSVMTAVEPEAGEPTSPVSLEDVFSEFKKGVEKQIDTQDYDTRYNLGIAYKEMGLLDEAIAEFQIASKDEKRFLECCSLLGLCFIEKGLPKLAIKWYEKGLASPGHTEEEYQSLKYELASTYELLGEWKQAYDIYLEVYGTNAGYRDVAQKIKELKEILNIK